MPRSCLTVQASYHSTTVSSDGVTPLQLFYPHTIAQTDPFETNPVTFRPTEPLVVLPAFQTVQTAPAEDSATPTSPHIVGEGAEELDSTAGLSALAHTPSTPVQSASTLVDVGAVSPLAPHTPLHRQGAMVWDSPATLVSVGSSPVAPAGAAHMTREVNDKAVAGSSLKKRQRHAEDEEAIDRPMKRPRRSSI